MSIQIMTKVANQIETEKDEFSFEYSDTLSSAGSGDWVLVPSGICNIAITLAVTAGSGKIQISNDLENIIRNDVPTAVDWPLGTVITTTEDSVLPVAAIRQVNFSGTTTLSMRAQ